MGLITNRRQDYGGDTLIQRYGPIIHGFGPPLDIMGHVGNMYIDKSTNELYVKREASGQGAWYIYLFLIPGSIVNQLNWYGIENPRDDLGSNTDYYVQYLSDNYSVYPLLIGPKVAGSWPSTAEGAPIPFQWNALNLYFIGLGSEVQSHEVINVTPVKYVGIGSEALGINLNTQGVIPVGVSTLGSPAVGWTLNTQGV